MQDTLKLLHIQREELIEEMARIDAAIKAYESGGEKILTLNEVEESVGMPGRINYEGMSTKSKPQRRNQRKGGKREDHILNLLNNKGPMTVPDITRALGSGSTYMYRVLPRMEHEGKVVKVGKTYKLA